MRRALFVMCLVCASALANVAAAPNGLQPVPHPNLDTLTPEVRRSLSPAIDQFESNATRFAGVELGRAYGKLGLHYQAHQQSGAGACFENAMVLDPESYQWPYYLAVRYEETGELALAVQNYQKSLGLNPGNNAGKIRLGLLLVEAGAIDDGERLLRRALDADPENAAVFAGLGTVAAGREDYAQAARYYQKALDIQPEATQLHDRLGLVYRQLGQPDLAREQLEKRGQRMPDIDDPLLSLMQAFSRPASDYIEMGTQALGRGAFEKAVTALTLAINIDSENSEGHIRLGQAYAALGRTAEGQQQLELAVQIDPGDADANFYLGALYEMQGEDSLAVSSYSMADKNRPGFLAAQLGLANALMRERRFSESAQKYAALVAGEPENAELRFWEGMAYLGAGQCKDAEQSLLAAFELAPGTGHVIHALSRLYSTCSDVGEAQRKNALAYAEMMYSRDPGLDTAETFAMALAANGMFSDAEELQAQALFEAAKLQDQDAAALLRQNFQRYQNETAAEMAWPLEHPVYAPPRMDLNSIR